MGKSRNTKYNNYYYDDDEYVDTRKSKKNKSEERRFQRALKTKNVYDLVDDEEAEQLANLRFPQH